MAVGDPSQFDLLLEVAQHQVASLMAAYKPSEVIMIAAIMQGIVLKAAKVQDSEEKIDKLPALVRNIRDSLEPLYPSTRNH